MLYHRQLLLTRMSRLYRRQQRPMTSLRMLQHRQFLLIQMPRQYRRHQRPNYRSQGRRTMIWSTMELFHRQQLRCRSRQRWLRIRNYLSGVKHGFCQTLHRRHRTLLSLPCMKSRRPTIRVQSNS